MKFPFAVLVLAVALAGCNLGQLEQAGQVGLGIAKAVSCATGGAGGLVTAKVEKAVKANQAWVGTTGEIIAASAEVCRGLGGSPGAPAN